MGVASSISGAALIEFIRTSGECLSPRASPGDAHALLLASFTSRLAVTIYLPSLPPPPARRSAPRLPWERAAHADLIRQPCHGEGCTERTERREEGRSGPRRHREGPPSVGEEPPARPPAHPPARSRPLIWAERRLIASTDGARPSAEISGGFRASGGGKRRACRETIGTSKAPPRPHHHWGVGGGR